MTDRPITESERDLLDAVEEWAFQERAIRFGCASERTVTAARAEVLRRWMDIECERACG